MECTTSSLTLNCTGECSKCQGVIFVHGSKWGSSPRCCLREIERLVITRLRIGQGRFRDGLALLEPLLSRMEQESWWGNTIEVQVLIAVAAGVLIDTFGVRTMLDPALAMLFGRWTWWPGRVPQARVAGQTPAAVGAEVRKGAGA